MITAKVIADSKNEFSNRITSMVITMPRYILAEFNTHRMLSKNSASSRAIPFEKMLKSIQENPFIPIAWMKDHKGMQGTEYFTDSSSINLCKIKWLEARNSAIGTALSFDNIEDKFDKEGNREDVSLTKQLVNRLLEPFIYHTVIVTATEWENFFALRCPKYKIKEEGEKYSRSWKDVITYYSDKATKLQDMSFDELAEDLRGYNTIQRLQKNQGQADIHMMALAEAMWDAYNESEPKQLVAGEWHIPFGDKISSNNLFSLFGSLNYETSVYSKMELEAKIKIATARCARVSYTVVGEEGKPDNYDADIKLHDRLAKSGHWSPFEHCAQAMGTNIDHEFIGTDNYWSGNFRGFIQYRKTFINENITK